MATQSSLNIEAKRIFNKLLGDIEKELDADGLALLGPIRNGGESKLRAAIEPLKDRRNKLAVILHTGGGVVEVAERMVQIIRHFYKEVVFIIPDVAMSAGTVFAMSGDAIMMDFASCLGPIDPQVEKDGKLVPALSYIEQYQRLVDKAQKKTITEAEFLVMKDFDLAELHLYEMARDLSVSLLEKWLATYKFKDWTETETRKLPVGPAERQARAKEIGTALMDNKRWYSHGRGISMKVLHDELNLRIDDFGADDKLSRLIHRYFSLVLDYGMKNGFGHIAHSREYF